MLPIILAVLYFVVGYFFTLWFLHKYLDDGEGATFSFAVSVHLLWIVVAIIIAASTLHDSIGKRGILLRIYGFKS